jgi:hypothetical protein
MWCDVGEDIAGWMDLLQGVERDRFYDFVGL